MRDRKGFTIAELLIVVAIIAVLVAIAIPVFSGALERSRQGVDISNLRSAYTAGRLHELTGPRESATLYYDPSSGDLSTAAPAGYMKRTQDKVMVDTSTLPSLIDYKDGDNHDQSYVITLFFDDEGKLYDMDFEAP